MLPTSYARGKNFFVSPISSSFLLSLRNRLDRYQLHLCCPRPERTSYCAPTPRENEPIMSLGDDWFESAAAAHGAKLVPNGHCQFTAQQRKPPFFEGWYLRLMLPNFRSFSFIFALEAPNKGTIQVIDNENNLLVYELDPSSRFHSSAPSEHWSFSQWGPRGGSATISVESSHSLHGYTTSASGSHGLFEIEGSNRKIVQWAFDYIPSLGWGNRGTGRHTGSCLAKFPVFEPGYQVLMAHGRVTQGYVRISGEDGSTEVDVDVQGATAYMEKNWGAQFPPKWFWIQSNIFEGVSDMCVVGVGAKRSFFVVEETVGMIAIHYKGELYEFSNWSAKNVDWDVRWGAWRMKATSRNGFYAHLVGTTSDENGTEILGPTDKGMRPIMKDCMDGRLHVALYEPGGSVLVDAISTVAQMEVGGDWNEYQDRWTANVKPLPQPLRGIINLFNRPKVKTDM